MSIRKSFSAWRRLAVHPRASRCSLSFLLQFRSILTEEGRIKQSYELLIITEQLSKQERIGWQQRKLENFYSDRLLLERRMDKWHEERRQKVKRWREYVKKIPSIKWWRREKNKKRLWKTRNKRRKKLSLRNVYEKTENMEQENKVC